MAFDVDKHWYQAQLSWKMRLLVPFSKLFGVITKTRRHLYQRGWLATQKFDVPIIVVGNLTVGGTGKTPFVIWLAAFLKSQGLHPGIVSRGVGGRKFSKPHVVSSQDQASEVGDEALLLCQQTQCPTVICMDRPAAVNELLRQFKCDIVISDDGLQHYRLSRAMEIVMIDNKRGLGNGYLLPAGPLREESKRLQAADFVILNRSTSSETINANFSQPTYAMRLQTRNLQSLLDASNTMPLTQLQNKTVHAIAGIGHPERFFQTLEMAGLHLIRHVFPDHHLYQKQDIQFHDELPIIMTAKDAVKCQPYATDKHWFLPVEAVIDEALQQKILMKLHF